MKKPRTERWGKTLACLVACLAMGGSLLSVAQPRYLPVTRPAPPDRTPAGAVDDVSAAEPHLWRNVVLHRTTETRARSRSLLGVAGPAAERNCHFLIRPDGAVVVSNAWREQRSVGQDPFDLHIGLVDGPFGNMIPRIQWNALTELLAHLRQRFGLDPARVTLADKSDATAWTMLPGGATGLRNLLAGSVRPK